MRVFALYLFRKWKEARPDQYRIFMKDLNGGSQSELLDFSRPNEPKETEKSKTNH